MEMRNKYSGYCFICGKPVEAGEGYAEIYKERWGVRCRPLCQPPENFDEVPQISENAVDQNVFNEEIPI